MAEDYMQRWQEACDEVRRLCHEGRYICSIGANLPDGNIAVANAAILDIDRTDPFPRDADGLGALLMCKIEDCKSGFNPIKEVLRETRQLVISDEDALGAYEALEAEFDDSV